MFTKFGKYWSIKLVAIVLLARATLVLADDLQTTLTLNTRTFELGVDTSSLDFGYGNIPLNEIPWLDEYLTAHPIYKNSVLKIRMHNSKSASHIWEDATLLNTLNPASSVPDIFQIDGYVHSSSQIAATNPRRVWLHQALTIRDHSVSCGADRLSENINVCTVRASYPPDQKLYISLSIYFPPPLSALERSFSDIAQDMRDVVFCLDVTEVQDLAAFAEVAFLEERLNECRLEKTS